MTRSIMRLCVWVGCLCLVSLAALAEPVVVERDSDLLSEPRVGSSVVARLRQGSQADASSSKGPWTSVKTSSGVGWVMSFNLRFGAGAAPGTPGNAAALSRLTAPPGRASITSTIGIRGFDTEDLRNARFDEKQVSLLETYSTSKDRVQASATAAGLKAEKVDYLR